MSDAVPSIFPWTNANSINKMETENLPFALCEGEKALPRVKESDIETVDAIKKFIEAQEKEIQDHQNSTPTPNIEKNNDDSMDSKISQSETMSVASSVMDMIISESEMEIARKAEMKNKFINTGDKGNSSMALSVGSKVEAKDYGDEWYSAEIIEVDYDEIEVLVHYETDIKKSDEWISVSSPRLRPVGSSTVKAGPSSAESWSSDTMAPGTSHVKQEIKEEKVEQKGHPTFVVGERCLARWRDNRRFVATIHNDLGNDSYEIIFDDGCHWTCKVSRLYKLRPGKEGVPSGAPHSPAHPPAEFAAGPSNVTPHLYPAYHTHLFDPTRDYLGSKSERREMKRKLNIKEIFNIGQKRPKTQKVQKEKIQKAPAEKKPRIIRRKPLKLKQEKIKFGVKNEMPAVDAVASIIGTITQEIKSEMKQEPADIKIEEKPTVVKIEVPPINVLDENSLETDLKTEHVEVKPVSETEQDADKIQLEDLKPYLDPEVLEEEVQLEQFEKPDEGTHEEVIDRIKEAINKLEGGLNQNEQTNSPKPEVKPELPKVKPEKPKVKPEIPKLKPEIPKAEPEIPKPEPEIPKVEIPENTAPVPSTSSNKESKKDAKKLSKIKKGKKLRMLHEKKVKKQVEKVKSELEEMRKQVEEMRKQMLKNQEMSKEGNIASKYLLPGEWCCKWVNGQPVGTVSEIECELKQDATGKIPLPRRSVQVEDDRLPEGWTKHMVRRSLGHSAGKWDVVLVNPDNRRFHTKNEMRVYLEHHPDQSLREYEYALTDFGVHLKLARRLGWISQTPDGVADGPINHLPIGTLSSTSPLIKRRSLGLKKKKSIKIKNKIPKLTIKMKVPRHVEPPEQEVIPTLSTQVAGIEPSSSVVDTNLDQLNTQTIEDGYVYVGSLKVQIIENLLRCPAEGCFKNFRNTTLLQMHIKHYHRELRKMMGATPKVLDLAYARTMPEEIVTPRLKDEKVIKVKLPRPPKPKPEREENKLEIKVDKLEPIQVDTAPLTPVKEGDIPIPRSQDSPKLRQALINKPVKRPRVLLPVRRPEQQEQVIPDTLPEEFDFEQTEPIEPLIEIPPMDNLDFETAISTHTVTKPLSDKKRKFEKKKKSFVLPPKAVISEEEDWFAANSDVETRSSFPRSGTPDSKVDIKAAPVSSESNEEIKDANYIYNENGERIKIVHMKREEIINCHCGFREEDGLMVQCELCLCWQHAICLNIQRQVDVPEKYTCSMCLNPWRGRRGARFVHDQDRLYEGLLPGGAGGGGGGACAQLRRSHELAGNLLRVDDALHALRVKYHVATKKDHPKLYLWAKDWEQVEIQYTQEKLNSDYSDLNIMISSIGKENLPIKPDDVKDIPLDIRTSPSEVNDHDRFSQRDIPLGSQSLLSGLLSSPGGASLDLPISTLELERLAKSVQEQECQRSSMIVPQPEAAIENSVCRERLLKHITRCHALIDSRLDSIEAQVAELESQNPSFQDDETAEFIPRTKQTIQMLMRDLDTMEELGVIT